jgi:hypothetical protein
VGVLVPRFQPRRSTSTINLSPSLLIYSLLNRFNMFRLVTMLFNPKFVVALLAISRVDAHKAIKSRPAASNFTLYTYSTNLTGLPVFCAYSMSHNLFALFRDQMRKYICTTDTSPGPGHIGNAVPSEVPVVQSV